MFSASTVRSSGYSFLYGGLTLLLVAGATQAKETDTNSAGPAPVREQTLREGRDLFSRAWVPNDPRSHGGDGLGPVFNARSCLACHDQGGPGGAGPVERNIDVATVTGGRSQGYQFTYSFAIGFGTGQGTYRSVSNLSEPSRRGPEIDASVLATVHPGFRTSRSVVLHHFGTDPEYHSWRAAVPGPHGTALIRTTQRNPTPLFGTALLDSLPDEAIEAAAKRKFPDSTRVRGRVSRLRDGRIGRFGWKAQTATLAEFVLSAAATEVGLELPGRHQAADPRLPGVGAAGLDMNEAECDALVAYVRSLPEPAIRESFDADEAARVKAGEATFGSIGCAGCHLPRVGDVEGVYSDLLLHDMGLGLGDTGSYDVFVGPPAGGEEFAAGGRGRAAGATDREWRTPPLWGLRDSGPYLHDGRALTIDRAITLHGGQGAVSARRYAQLSSRRKQQLGAFLNSLCAPAAEDELPSQSQRP
ncbi:di-heme oxidoredictase family protein [Singulisphaera sp. Ch08]|uniref:Di-heme oxidoredictase family protein n=1 Tax=Singulisphaera sp. Ch08 TaxID=3120278 RepID=A0AAU7CDS4_9BACT